MNRKDKIEIRRFEKYWEKQGRKDFFTWVHRYLRLNNELLADNTYQGIYDLFRKTLILYLRKDIDCEDVNDEDLGEVIDSLADIFNNDNAIYVNKYKPVVNELYDFYKKYPNYLNKVRIT